MLLVYALVVAVCILFARPRLLIYNATIEQVRPLVDRMLLWDPAVRWAGECCLANAWATGPVEGNGPLRTVSSGAPIRRGG